MRCRLRLGLDDSLVVLKADLHIRSLHALREFENLAVILDGSGPVESAFGVDRRVVQRLGPILIRQIRIVVGQRIGMGRRRSVGDRGGGFNLRGLLGAGVVGGGAAGLGVVTLLCNGGAGGRYCGNPPGDDGGCVPAAGSSGIGSSVFDFRWIALSTRSYVAWASSRKEGSAIKAAAPTPPTSTSRDSTISAAPRHRPRSPYRGAGLASGFSSGAGETPVGAGARSSAHYRWPSARWP